MSNFELTVKVEEALDSIRPFLQMDGGDVELVEIDEDNNANIRLIGNCVSCSMSAMTMKAGIEGAIRKVAPEINKVVAVNL
ncbi:MAG: NifU family protein [Bacteroidetes bacterium]|nr:NifU family protein [Bacteroidota bacterium]